MLKLTKKADYSLIALKHFAAMRAVAGSDASAALSAKELADSSGIPLPLLSKLLQKLGKSGFLVDGPIVLANCFTSATACGHADRCTIKKPLRRIHEGILRLLDSVSIQDMLRDSEEDELPGLSASLVALESLPAASLGREATRKLSL